MPKFVAVVGSRAYPREDAVRSFVRRLARKYPDATLVSGACPCGVDTWAEREAVRCGLKTLIFPADWNGPLGKGAGFARNLTIVEHAEIVVAFCNPQSRGTSDTIRKAVKLKRQLFVYNENVELITDGTGYWC